MPGHGSEEAAKVQVECIVPILRVANLSASLGYYRDVLGFRWDWGDPDGSDMVSVSRDGHAIMLCQGAHGQPGTWIWIGVEDIDPLYQDYRRRGVQFREAPADRPWAYEMQIVDPDGHILRFGSEPRSAPPSPSAGGSA
jgi:catechol 2,3-dioxygenase-like lactoylglutathione lyase family enzyme